MAEISLSSELAQLEIGERKDEVYEYCLEGVRVQPKSKVFRFDKKACDRGRIHWSRLAWENAKSEMKWKSRGSQKKRYVW
jgi:phage terminase large subunit-like protein